MEDFNKTKARLKAQFIRLMKKSNNNNDEVVLCEDGKETSNTYPLWGLFEIDMKSPDSWIRDIILHHYTFEHKTSRLSFILRKA